MKTCSICQTEYDDICGRCVTIQQTCVLCLTKFELSESVIRCRECFYMGHQQNFSEWLKKHGSCPACRSPYSEESFDEIELKDGVIKELYLEKSSVYFKRQQIFNHFSFQYPYYDFQNYVLDDILSQLKFDDSHLLVSPPGSGKTIIGLAVASYFSVNTLVLTPNLAVLGSWIDRLSMFFDEDNSKIGLQEIYTRSTGDLKPITITTYQQLNTSLRDHKKNKSKKLKKKKLLLDSPFNFIDRLIYHDIGLVILDEAHRLTEKWGEDLIKFLEMLGEVKILGLTATPPQDMDEEFDQIFADRRTEIPLPMLVREGVLVPFRDFAVIQPDIEEIKKMASKMKKLSKEDYLTTLRGELLERTLSEVSFLEENFGQFENSYNERWLASNLSLVTFITIDILLHELEVMGDKFRGLILLEQENIPSRYNLDQKGTGGAIGIFSELSLIPQIDAVDPIFVTGKSLLIDKDFAEQFEKLSIAWIEEAQVDISFSIKKTRRKYAIVNGSGSDWNTDTYTRYVTYLFEHGHTKLLIGTRFLLGEGWDSQTLNTVVDLTTFATYAFVNQVKGRALRKNPNDETKVSHMWEIAPNRYLTPYSLKELENYNKRHSIYFGIDDTGRIRNGYYRLNDRFSARGVKSMSYDEELATIFEKSSDRSPTIELWQVGRKLGDLFYSLDVQLDLPGIADASAVARNYNVRTRKREFLGYLEQVIESGIEQLLRKFELVGTYLEVQMSATVITLHIYIPVETEYSLIEELREELKKNSPKKSIGLQISSYTLVTNKIWAFFVSLFGKSVKAVQHDVLVTLPWETWMVTENDILAKGEIRNESFQINQLLEVQNYKLDVMQNLPISTNKILAQDFVEYFVTQKVYKSKIRDAQGPFIDNTVSISVNQVLLDQEYVDNERLYQMRKISDGSM